VSLAIGAILVFGATQAYVDSRNAYAVNEAVARMQENARYAMSVLEPDIRMANYWGLIKGAESITGRVLQSGAQSSLGGSASTTCGKNFGIDLEANVQGSNDAYVTTAAGCQPKSRFMPNSDTITLRRAAYALSDKAVKTGPLRICSTRTAGALVTDTDSSALCTAATWLDDAPAQVNDLIVNLYYIDRDSDQANNVPSLRRKFLTAAPGFDDAEIVPNVEDMQIQYGVDTSGGLGAKSGAATRYLDAGATLDGLLTSNTNPAQIVSVRVWLLIRSDQPEVGFTDTNTYEYGNRAVANGTTADLTSSGASPALKAFQPSSSTDESLTSPKRYRRILVSRTFYLRNALGT
jgi:type IV pilus assembly protein PilW